MKKISCILLSILFVMSMMTGCNQSANNSKENVQSEEGKDIDVADMEQFRQPEQGDTVAEIVIRDYLC
jgi:hypothetical protein